ncbi:MAG: ABC transporter permease [Deltaproteobacteria bacterium]|jgi:ABC-2 type transport system permease protein|nr:ABC transporter permease [Deltaproteobacteria bacterium]
MTSRQGRFLRRVAAMAAKEVLHIRRDPRTLYIALALPVIMLLLLGFGLSFDIERIPLVVADGDRSAASRELARAVFGSRDFAAVAGSDARAAQTELRRGQAMAALVIPAGFARELDAGRDSPVQLLVDGSDGNTARQIMGKIDAILRAHGGSRAGFADSPPLAVKVSTLWNPASRSALFMVPGVAAYLLAIAAVLLTALTIAAEWERGSMEQLFASPVGRLEIVLGKLLPYLALGMLQLLLVISLGTTVFDVPIHGSLPMIFVAGLLFLTGMLGQGLLVSVLARNQLVATQAGALSSLVPSLLLSGMLVPIENMPWILQALTVVVPARYLVHALRTLMLKGGGFQVIALDLLALLAFAVVILALATLRFKRRLA